jgi:hypothetical protein
MLIGTLQSRQDVQGGLLGLAIRAEECHGPVHHSRAAFFCTMANACGDTQFFASSLGFENILTDT